MLIADLLSWHQIGWRWFFWPMCICVFFQSQGVKGMFWTLPHHSGCWKWKQSPLWMSKPLAIWATPPILIATLLSLIIILTIFTIILFLLLRCIFFSSLPPGNLLLLPGHRGRDASQACGAREGGSWCCQQERGDKSWIHLQLGHSSIGRVIF